MDRARTLLAHANQSFPEQKHRTRLVNKPTLVRNIDVFVAHCRLLMATTLLLAMLSLGCLKRRQPHRFANAPRDECRQFLIAELRDLLLRDRRTKCESHRMQTR